MQDDRAELLAGVHACLLSHLSASQVAGGAVQALMQARVPLSPLAAPSLNMNTPIRDPPSAAAAHHYDLCHANAEAIQVRTCMAHCLLHLAHMHAAICDSS